MGNIPYDATEQQLIKVFSTAGHVLQFRIASSRETGKPQGFGFCEFADAAMAESAIRNLNGKEVNDRPLRVSSAETHNSNRRATKEREEGSNKNRTRTDTSNASSALQGPEIGGPQVGGTGVDAISQIVNSMSRDELVEVLSETKRLISNNRDGMKKLLLENPQLAQTLLQIQVRFGLVKPEDIASFSKGPAATGAPVPNPSGYTTITTSTGYTTMTAGPPSAAPVAHAPPPQAGPPVPDAAMVAQILRMDPATIMQLPPQIQAQVRQVQYLVNLTPDQLAQLPPAEQTSALRLQEIKRSLHL